MPPSSSRLPLFFCYRSITKRRVRIRSISYAIKTMTDIVHPNGRVMSVIFFIFSKKYIFARRVCVQSKHLLCAVSFLFKKLTQKRRTLLLEHPSLNLADVIQPKGIDVKNAAHSTCTLVISAEYNTVNA